MKMKLLHDGLINGHGTSRVLESFNGGFSVEFLPFRLVVCCGGQRGLVVDDGFACCLPAHSTPNGAFQVVLLVCERRLRSCVDPKAYSE